MENENFQTAMESMHQLKQRRTLSFALSWRTLLTWDTYWVSFLPPPAGLLRFSQTGLFQKNGAPSAFCGRYPGLFICQGLSCATKEPGLLLQCTCMKNHTDGVDLP